MTIPENELLTASPLPDFSKLDADGIATTFEQLLDLATETLARLAEQADLADWQNFAEPYCAVCEQINRLWGVVEHMHSVCDNAAWRQAHAQTEPLLVNFWTILGQDRKLYEAWRRVAERRDKSWPLAWQAMTRQTIQSFELSGVALAEAESAQYKGFSLELAQLSSQFAQNVLDASDDWFCTVPLERLHGVPEDVIAQSKQLAVARDESAYTLSLKAPVFIPVMQFADDRALRAQLYQAYATRASDQSEQNADWDNSAIMTQILNLRRQMAELLGFSDYGQYALETRMAQTTDEIESFLLDVLAKAKPVAEQEFAELQAFAQQEYGLTTLAAWDISYLSEQHRRKTFNFSSDELRAYFPLEQVLQGLTALLSELFAITLTEDKHAVRWHEDVRCYQVVDGDGVCGSLYLDLFARTGKRGGGWMHDAVSRTATYQPVAYFCCNFAAPSGDHPTLLSHDEVETIFHEMGHALHHVLSKINIAQVSGVNGVEWDAVELPSQFLEHFAWDKSVLQRISKHHKTGERLPDALFARMQKARRYHAGLHLVRQIEFALFDIRIHSVNHQNTPINEVLAEVRALTSVTPVPPWQRFAHSFTHVFAGGYAAGYYSYLWAEVLATDAYHQFSQQPGQWPTLGKKFKDEILAVGASRPALTSFTAFKGSAPSVQALFDWYFGTS